MQQDGSGLMRHVHVHQVFGDRIGACEYASEWVMTHGPGNAIAVRAAVAAAGATRCVQITVCLHVGLGALFCAHVEHETEPSKQAWAACAWQAMTPKARANGGWNGYG